MSRDKRYTSKDYLALGLSLLLAFAVWFVHNLSATYSDVVKCSFVIESDIDGHAHEASSASEVVARCTMTGFDILSSRFSGKRTLKTVAVSHEHIHHRGGDAFYMVKDDLARYFHEMFTSGAGLEYFVTDTLNLVFHSVDYKKVPVRILSSVGFKPQYTAVGKLRVEPDSVLLYGREELLDAVSEISTELISADNLSSDFYGEIALKPVENIRLSTTNVRFLLPVVRYVEQSVSVPVVAVNVPDGVNMQVFPNYALLRLREIFPGTQLSDTVCVKVDFLDFEQGRSGQCLGTVDNLPSDVMDYDIDPEVFNCIVNNKF